MSKEMQLGDVAILRCMGFERNVVVVCRDADDSSVFVVRAADEVRTDYWPVDGKYLHKVEE